jgi:L-fucose isomerase-like protein
MGYKIAYIAYADDTELKNRSISILNDFFGEENYDFQDDLNEIIFVASGGSEKNVLKLPKDISNVILLCHRESNSFAAAIEIAAYFRQKGKRVSLIDVFAARSFQEFQEVYKVHQAIDALANQKAALIGEVSDWLIVSDIEDEVVYKRLGVELLRLPWSSLDDYRQKQSSASFLTYFPDSDASQLQDTAKVYSLLDEVVKNHNLSAISVECFSLVKRDQVTACLPLAVLNKQNIVAACEGDICSMIGKMIIRNLIGFVPWQANIAEIKEDVILFAHCTAPLHLLDSFSITTHYETGVGTAIQGKFSKGEVGVFRLNNTLDKFMLLKGEVVERPRHSFACRTQIEFKTTKEQAALLKNRSLGNHQLIFPAEFIPLLIRMMSQLEIKRVE